MLTDPACKNATGPEGKARIRLADAPCWPIYGP